MITYNPKNHKMTFTGKDEKLVRQYAKKHKMTFRQVVILALKNGVAKGYFDKEIKNEI